MVIDADVKRRFFAKVDKGGPGGCWLWTAGLRRTGYGRLKVAGQDRPAHRVSWEIHRGPIPRGSGHHGTVVAHRCDVRNCVRPDHLWLGTQAENLQDAARKGRHRARKLTAGIIRAIRRSVRAGETRGALAKKYGVCAGTIGDIIRGNSWGHVA